MGWIMFRAGSLLSAFALLTIGSPAFAQRQALPMPNPQLLTVMPPGARAGSTVEITLTGQELDSPQKLLFSVPGIQAELVSAAAPAADAKKPGKQAPAPAAAIKYKVAIPADAPVGIHDVRLVNALGVSNPRAFVIGDLPETLEKEPNNDVPQAQRIDLNSTVNGAIVSPTDVDYYVFAGKKGQRVVASCLASSIDSRLFTGLELYSKQGSLLAANREYHGADAVLDCTLPHDGDYYVRVFAFTYTQGDPEHFYRLSVSTAPWIDAVYPPVVEPGKKTTVTVYGRNLPGGKPDPVAILDGRPLEKLTVTVEAPSEAEAQHQLRFTSTVAPRSAALDGFEFRLRNESGVSNPYLLRYARAPVVLDNEANDTSETAQEIPVPCEIAGRVEKKGDRDYYRFHAKKGEIYSIEAFGDRLDSPVSLNCLIRPRGKDGGTEFSDNNESLHPTLFFTRTEDPARMRFAVPADGDYILRVSSRDADLHAGPRHLYRIRIAPEQPDFQLIVMPPATSTPDACVVRQDGRSYYTVLVWRLDGFAGEVKLSAEGLPEGVTCPPQVVGPNQKLGTLVISAAANAPAWTGAITVKGTASIQGQEAVRVARPATITWPVPPQPQNIVTISRLDRELVLAVRDKAPYSLTAGVEAIAATPGQKLTIPIKLVRHWPDLKGNAQVTALNQIQPAPLNFNNNQPFNLSKDEMNLTVDVRSNTPPGAYTLVFKGQIVASVAKELMTKEKRSVAIIEPSSPITITVLPQAVVKVSLSSSAVALKAGESAELTVRVNRLNNFNGPLKVQLLVPKDVKGIQAPDVEIPKGKTEARITIKADEDASPGKHGDLLVHVVATLKNKLELKQDTKLSVNISK
jgi:hypothetical protein